MDGVVMLFCIDNYSIYIGDKLRIKSSFTSIKFVFIIHVRKMSLLKNI